MDQKVLRKELQKLVADSPDETYYDTSIHNKTNVNKFNNLDIVQLKQTFQDEFYKQFINYKDSVAINVGLDTIETSAIGLNAVYSIEGLYQQNYNATLYYMNIDGKAYNVDDIDNSILINQENNKITIEESILLNTNYN